MTKKITGISTYLESAGGLGLAPYRPNGLGFAPNGTNRVPKSVTLKEGGGVGKRTTRQPYRPTRVAESGGGSGFTDPNEKINPFDVPSKIKKNGSGIIGPNGREFQFKIPETRLGESGGGAGFAPPEPSKSILPGPLSA